jgi:DNA-binding NarL/FixJ family response regulator
VTISVAVADDQALVRVGFCGIIAATQGFSVVGEAANGAEAVEVARAVKPDVILMDVRMPDLDGIEATRRITTAPETARVRVIILTTFDLDDYVFAALRAGASGFLLKDTLPADLLTAIRVVAAGDALLAPSITRRLIEEFAGRPSPDHCPCLDELTPRELDVLRLIAAGRSNAEIASDLVIGESTVKTHVARVLMKLGVRDWVQAVVAAYEAGVITPGRRGAGRDR